VQAISRHHSIWLISRIHSRLQSRWSSFGTRSRYLFGFFVPVSPKFLAVFVYLTTWNLQKSSTALLAIMCIVYIYTAASFDPNKPLFVNKDHNALHCNLEIKVFFEISHHLNEQSKHLNQHLHGIYYAQITQLWRPTANQQKWFYLKSHQSSQIICNNSLIHFSIWLITTDLSFY